MAAFTTERARNLKRGHRVDLPDGDHAYVRILTAAEGAELQKDEVSIAGQLICTEDGTPVGPEVGEWPIAIVQALSKAALELNGLSEGGDDAAKK